MKEVMSCGNLQELLHMVKIQGQQCSTRRQRCFGKEFVD